MLIDAGVFSSSSIKKAEAARFGRFFPLWPSSLKNHISVFSLSTISANNMVLTDPLTLFAF